MHSSGTSIPPILLERFILGLTPQKVASCKTLLRSIQMTSGDFSSKNSNVHSGRELPDYQDELKVTPMGDIHRDDWMEYEIREPAAHRSQLKYHNLVELLLDRT